MKEIIKRGTKEIATCKTCGCVFSYEKEDLVHDNGEGWKEYVTCPQCTHEVVIRQSK